MCWVTRQPQGSVGPEMPSRLDLPAEALPVSRNGGKCPDSEVSEAKRFTSYGSVTPWQKPYYARLCLVTSPEQGSSGKSPQFEVFTPAG